jgi:very-short-patch-repair endonuclease
MITNMVSKLPKNIKNKATVILPQVWRAYGLPKPKVNYKFDRNHVRKFELDFAWLEIKLGVEIQGQIWMKGGHTSGVGYRRDLEKKHMLIEQGWILLEFEPKHIRFDLIKKKYDELKGI